MPSFESAAIRRSNRWTGSAENPVAILPHSSGSDHSFWDVQAAALSPYFHVLRYDTRGHGATEAVPGDYTVEMLARDALALADALGIGKFAWCGLSLAGMIGQWLGANASDRLTALVLANT